MEWAEEIGIGEMGLAPDVFWSLTLAQFHLKHAAFMRAEDRQRSLVYLLAGLIGQFSEKDKATAQRNANALKRYPVKSWLRGEE